MNCSNVATTTVAPAKHPVTTVALPIASIEIIQKRQKQQKHLVSVRVPKAFSKRHEPAGVLNSFVTKHTNKANALRHARTPHGYGSLWKVCMYVCVCIP